ncbi:MAG: 4-aminobutyrate aminotransferase [Planctomycetota bacterium]|jgi:4-aminobutyrate aminotransferase
MISEQELAELSFADAPKIITDTVPGPETSKLLAEAPDYESMTRGGGGFPLVFDIGKGVTVKDPDGNLYIDVSAGVGVNSVGRAHPRVIAAMEQQSKRLMHASDISNTRRSELARKIASIAPPGLKDNCITYFCQSGSGALESAIKFARKVTGRNQILAFHGAYHGVWNASNALTTGEQYRKGYGPFMGGVIHAPYQYCYRCPFGLKRESCELACANYVDHVLNTPYTAADDVAAVIIEPLQGEGGYIPPDPEFLQIIKAACVKHGALFIADEVQAGTGRTGKMWSIEHAGVEPDMLTFGKGMGGDLPMAGVIMRKDLADQLDPMSQPQTFAANAVSAAVSITNIDIILENDLVNRAAELGAEVLERLKSASDDIAIIGEVRGRGLMIGIELVKDKQTREPLDGDNMIKVVMGLLSNGIIMVPCGRYGNVLRLMPSLTITRDYMNKAVDILLNVLRGV